MQTRIRFEQFAVVAAVLALLGAQIAPAQQAMPAANGTQGLAALHAASPASTTGAAAKPAAAQEEDKNAPAAGKPDGGGIKIHGHWVLEVKNPDGKLVERREFNNSLVTGGAYVSGDQLLAAILTGDLTPGGFAVALITGSTAGQDPTSLCYSYATAPSTPPAVGCFTLLDSSTIFPDWLFGKAYSSNNPPLGGEEQGLTTSVNFAPTVSIVVSGNFTVGAGMAPIAAVQTWMLGCGNSTNAFGPNYTNEGDYTQALNARFTGSNQPELQSGVAPSACTQAKVAVGVATPIGVLTSTAVPGGPLTVTTGQIITIQVTLSFS
jgi:hypothetical protein